MNGAQQPADRHAAAWNETGPTGRREPIGHDGDARPVIGVAVHFAGIAWRAFGRWRERRRARAALSRMTSRELTDVGLTACDRAMILDTRGWNDPDSGRNIPISAQNRFSDRLAREARLRPFRRTPA